MTANLHASTRGLARDTQGVAAIEFALLASVLITLFLGITEVTRFILVTQKVEKTATGVSDMISQGTSISTTEVDQILNAVSYLMSPYTTGTTTRIIVSSVYQNGTGTQPVIRWQRAGGGTLSGSSQIGINGGTATLPGGLTLTDRDNVIVAEMYYSYTPIISSRIIPAQTVYKKALFKARLGDLTTLN